MGRPSKLGDKGKPWVASMASHSAGFGENDDDMPINRGASSIWGGTEWIYLDGIADLGISRCTREHVHLVDVSHAERREAAMAKLKNIRRYWPPSILASRGWGDEAHTTQITVSFRLGDSADTFRPASRSDYRYQDGRGSVLKEQ